MWKWCLKISREIGHFLPRFRFERNESRDADHVLSSRSSQDREHVISSRSSLTWGEQVPMMFSAHNNSSSCMFSFTIFIFYENLGRFCSNFCIQLFFVQNAKNKNSKLKREGRSIGDVLQPYFFPSLFFLCTFTKILYHFFFYPISFCSGINTKTKTWNWKGQEHWRFTSS